MKTNIYQHSDLVYHQQATMKVVGSHCKLDRWYYDLLCKADGQVYTTVERYMVLKERASDRQVTSTY